MDRLRVLKTTATRCGIVRDACPGTSTTVHTPATRPVSVVWNPCPGTSAAVQKPRNACTASPARQGLGLGRGAGNRACAILVGAPGRRPDRAAWRSWRPARKPCPLSFRPVIRIPSSTNRFPIGGDDSLVRCPRLHRQIPHRLAFGSDPGRRRSDRFRFAKRRGFVGWFDATHGFHRCDGTSRRLAATCRETFPASPRQAAPRHARPRPAMPCHATPLPSHGRIGLSRGRSRRTSGLTMSSSDLLERRLRTATFEAAGRVPTVHRVVGRLYAFECAAELRRRLVSVAGLCSSAASAIGVQREPMDPIWTLGGKLAEAWLPVYRLEINNLEVVPRARIELATP